MRHHWQLAELKSVPLSLFAKADNVFCRGMAGNGLASKPPLLDIGVQGRLAPNLVLTLKDLSQCIFRSQNRLMTQDDIMQNKPLVLPQGLH